VAQEARLGQALFETLVARQGQIIDPVRQSGAGELPHSLGEVPRGAACDQELFDDSADE
jgi:hypothetical protein